MIHFKFSTDLMETSHFLKIFLNETLRIFVNLTVQSYV